MRTDNDILSQYFEAARSQEPVVSFAEVQAMVSMASASEYSDSFNKSQAHSFSRWVTFYRNTIKSRNTMVFIGVVVGAIISMFYLFNKIKYAEEPGTPKTQTTVVVPETGENSSNESTPEISEEVSASETIQQIEEDANREELDDAPTENSQSTVTSTENQNLDQETEQVVVDQKTTEVDDAALKVNASEEVKSSEVVVEKPTEKDEQLSVKSTTPAKNTAPKNTWKTGSTRMTLPAKASQSRVNLFVKKLQKSGIDLKFGTLKFKDGKIDRIQGTMECATAGARFRSDEMDSLTVTWKNIRYSHDPQNVDLRIHSKMTRKSTTSVEIWEIE